VTSIGRVTLQQRPQRLQCSPLFDDDDDDDDLLKPKYSNQKDDD
jgi:hypothetical protein